jgi:23S rRNA (guanosine2251-2'-O)-methyltransferase
VTRGSELVYGMHAVRMLLARHPERVVRIWLLSGRDDSRAREIARLAQQNARPVEHAPAHRFKQLVGESVHQGIVAEIEPLPPWSEEDLLGALAGLETPLLLALDGVQDPHNLGACLRTADACGALAIVIPKDRAAQLTGSARKVAAGAAETTPVVTVTNLARSLRLLKDAGLWVVGADAQAPQRAQDADLSQGVVLVLGAEETGLRRLTRECCDALVKLPQLGAVESLNVSVAAAMLLYEAVRQRGADSARKAILQK